MKLSTNSLSGMYPHPKQKLNIPKQFPDVSEALRAKKARVDTKLFKNFTFIDISRSNRAGELKLKHRIWPVYKRTGQIEYEETFHKFNDNKLRERYLKLFLLMLGFGVFIYLFFRSFEITM
jgi:hypothetical protein